MSYSFRVIRRVAITTMACLIGLAGILSIVQLGLPEVIGRRLHGAVEKREDIRGAVENIRVCLPCASYTLVRPDFQILSDREWQPLFSADEVVVSLLPATLFDGTLAGEVRLAAPFFHFRSEGESSQTNWSEIGDLLLPVPLDRFSVSEGRVELANLRLDSPVRLLLTDVELLGTNISRADADPIEFEAEGRVDGEGDLRAQLRLPEGEGFRLETTMDAVPVKAFNDYLTHGFGVDVTAGTLAADGEVSGNDQGLKGTIHCRVDDLDVLDFDDLSTRNPLGLLWETFAATTLAAARTSSDRAFEFQLQIRESVDDPHVDAWSLFGTVLRRSLWGLLESPANTLGWLAQRARPMEQD